MDERRLNKAEIVGLQVADENYQRARQAFQAAMQARGKIYASVGLSADLRYSIAADGAVTVEPTSEAAVANG